MQKAYYVLLAIVTFVCMMMAIPGAALLTAVVTFGLSYFLLAPLPNLAIFLWSLLPAVWCWKFRTLRLPLLLAGAALPGYVYLIPPVLADKAVKQDLAERSDLPAASINFANPPGVEIHRNAEPASDWKSPGYSSGNSSFLDETPCFDLCERLLTGGDVAWVRIVLNDDNYGKFNEDTRAVFFRGTSKKCLALYPDFPAGKPCLLFAPDHRLPAGVTIHLKEERNPRTSSKSRFYQPYGYRTATAFAGSDSGAPLIYQATQIFHQRPLRYISFDYGNFAAGFEGHGGFQYAREKVASPPINLERDIVTLGLTLGSSRTEPLPSPQPEDQSRNTPPDPQDAIYIASLLKTVHTGHNTFPGSIKRFVTSWHTKLKNAEQISQSDHSVFCAALKDERLGNQPLASRVAEKHFLPACGTTPWWESN